MTAPAAPGQMKTTRWLALARLVVLIYAALVVASLIWSLPAFYESRRQLVAGTVPATAFYGWSTGQLDAASAALGLPLTVAAGLLFGASLVSLVCFIGVGALIFWRRSDSGMGLLFAFTLISTGPGFSGLLLSESQLPAWARDAYSLSALLVWPVFFVALYVFPDGHFVPRWTRYLALLPFLLFVSSVLIPASSPWALIAPLVLILYLLGGLASQIYRYRRVSTFAARQQTKWVVFVLGLMVTQVLAVQVLLPLLPGLAIGTPVRFLFELSVSGLLGYLLPALIPLAIAVAILRYRLFDIDIIIRRTLIYALLTALLALAYFGSVLVLQNIFSALTGQAQSTLVTVLSTLIIAALFVPLRRRVQSLIDRRLYRRKYDSARTLADFGSSVRDDVDLDGLSARLVGVVDDALRPASVGLWLTNWRASGQPATSFQPKDQP